MAHQESPQDRNRVSELDSSPDLLRVGHDDKKKRTSISIPDQSVWRIIQVLLFLGVGGLHFLPQQPAKDDKSEAKEIRAIIATMRQDVDALTHSVTVLQTQINDFKEMQSLRKFQGSAPTRVNPQFEGLTPGGN